MYKSGVCCLLFFIAIVVASPENIGILRGMLNEINHPQLIMISKLA